MPHLFKRALFRTLHREGCGEKGIQETLFSNCILCSLGSSFILKTRFLKKRSKNQHKRDEPLGGCPLGLTISQSSTQIALNKIVYRTTCGLLLSFYVDLRPACSSYVRIFPSSTRVDGHTTYYPSSHNICRHYESSRCNNPKASNSPQSFRQRPSLPTMLSSETL